jgi:small redox-active disulfide protein 2
MTEKDVVQIQVNGQPVGIIGFKSVLEETAREFRERSDEEVAEEMLRLLGRRNYIPDRSREEYGRTFVREFRKFLGQPYEEEAEEGLNVKVLGPGCPRCDSLEQEVMAAMAETNMAGGIEHVRDAKEIASFGVMGTPALVVNGKVKCVGRVPSRKQIVGWIKEEKR